MDAKEAGILCEKLNPEVFLSVTETGSFKVLVNTIYPFSGYVGLLLFLVMLYRDIKKEKRTD